MPRTARRAPGGIIFHCLNRGVGRRTIFYKDRDYAAFERVMAHALEAVPLGLLGYCLMPNHWHLVLWPERDGDLGRFMHNLTVTHARRWQEHYHKSGMGHLYQGRFRSFPVQDGPHFTTMARYVERNALRAGLVQRAERWPWSSLWRRLNPRDGEGRPSLPLAAWPVTEPGDWVQWVNEAQSDAEIAALRGSVVKCRPWGEEAWQAAVTQRLGLQSAYRAAGRPRKEGG